MTEEERNRIVNIKTQRHKQFYKIAADDSDVTDIESDEEERCERARLHDEARRDCQELNMPFDENMNVFLDATSSIRKLASVVDSQKRSRLRGLEKVMMRTTVMATTGYYLLYCIFEVPP